MSDLSLSILPAAEATPYQDLLHRHGAPLLVLDCAVVRRQYRALQQALPGVRLHYAVKSLPAPELLATLAEAGSAFDLATDGEIELLRAQGIGAEHCIHTHPIKRDSDIRAALDFGCRTFVVDNADEIDKFRGYRQRVSLLLRISFRSPSAGVDLSRKFGCAVADVPALLSRARMQGIVIDGLSFHVGSQCASADSHAEAIDACAQILRDEQARGSALRVLDIGGGFPANYGAGAVDIQRWCAPIRAALARLPQTVELIAEPGRFISAPAMTGLFSVIGRAERDGRPWYYLDDGLYGAFSGQLFDHVNYPLQVFSDSAERRPSVLAGPTCDSIDVIAEDIALPVLALGDLLVGREMGAYTAATATEFNAIPKTRIVAINQRASLSRAG